MKKWIFIFFVFGILLNPNSCFGFTFSVNATPETCSGNGSLNFNVSNKDASGSIVFYVYKLPNTNVPISTLTSSSLTGLSSGDYLVVAKETIGNKTTIQQNNATINNNIVSLAYNIKMLNQACSSTSNITINTFEGTAATYQIVSGPLLFPVQTSNTFNGLPVGVYKVKVVDICGNSVVQTFTVTLNTASLTVSPPIITDLVPVDCTKAKVTQTITAAPGTVIGYPLKIQYKLILPDSSTKIIDAVLSNGDLTSQDITQILPSYVDQSYSYSITITDLCGVTYTTSDFQVSPQLNLAGEVLNLECNKYGIRLNASNYAAPYTLNFLSYPDGFTPINFNSSYPGPYNKDAIVFGTKDNPVPFGIYTVTITDACNRTFTTSVNVINKPPEPIAIGMHNGCLTDDGKIYLEIPNYKIVTAIIKAAPASYPFPLPHDVTAIINSDGILVLNPVPLGNYTIIITDNCNDIILPVNITVPIYKDLGVTTDLRPGCDLQKTSIKIESNNSKLKTVKITAAPPGFGFALPYNASNNIISQGINNGVFYMDNLPSGDYTFSTVDQCDFTTTTNLTLEGYQITDDSFSLVTNCGSFDIPLNYVCNGNANESFWLQKQLPSDTWGNPYTNKVYPDGTVPNDTNSLSLLNKATNYNLTVNGTFRIIHHFSSYYSGSDYNNGNVSTVDKECLEVLAPTMSFKQVLEIVDIYRMPCSPSGGLDVVVVANGTPPLHYSIIDSNGNEISDNGSSNVFSNLAPGIYRFQVEDNCGNSVNGTFDVSALLPLATVNLPCDVSQCVNTITGNESFDLTTLNSTILGSQSPTQYTLSYYTSISDAQAGTNPINNLTNFVPKNNPQTIYIRLYYNELPNCYETGSFNLMVTKTPKIKLNPSYLKCSTDPVTLNAGIGNPASTTYLWSNGDTSPTMTVSQIGETNLSVTATNIYSHCNNIPVGCSTTQDVKVILTDTPKIDGIEFQDWTNDENSITIISTQAGKFEYSLDGINYQDNCHFTQLKTGFYTVYVRDVNGCNTIHEEVALLNYPKYFTPNGDGYNETWRIKNSEFEPNFKVDVFDRYGKLLTSFYSNSAGWDGTYNGYMMLSDDYWFLVTRQNGKIHRGHFTLKR